MANKATNTFVQKLFLTGKFNEQNYDYYYYQ